MGVTSSKKGITSTFSQIIKKKKKKRLLKNNK